MPTASLIPMTVHSPQQDAGEIKQLEQLLSSTAQHPKLVDSHGVEIPLPDSVYEALRNVVQAMAMAPGQAITLIPDECELTTQKAADLLNVSRPFLVKLLDQREIPCAMVGTHRRVKFQDLIVYQRKRDAERHQNLNNLTEFLQEEGFYNNDRESSDCI
jgi:excisionase family DNA binding protein